MVRIAPAQRAGLRPSVHARTYSHVFVPECRGSCVAGARAGPADRPLVGLVPQKRISGNERGQWSVLTTASGHWRVIRRPPARVGPLDAGQPSSSGRARKKESDLEKFDQVLGHSGVRRGVPHVRYARRARRASGVANRRPCLPTTITTTRNLTATVMVFATYLMAALICQVLVTTTAVRCRGNPTKHRLMCPPTRKQYRPLPVGMVRPWRTARAGEERKKVYSETRGFYCQGPPHCGDGSGNSDCWCDGGDRKELGSGGLYYCQDPTADGQVCTALMPSAPGVRPNLRTGEYIEGACVIDPPNCGEIAIVVAEMGIATSIAGIPAAALATKVFIGATSAGVSLGGLIAHMHCS